MSSSMGTIISSAVANTASVLVTLTWYSGLIHDYGQLNPIAHVPAVQTGVLQAGATLRKALAE